jgi:hypothetical protein
MLNVSLYANIYCCLSCWLSVWLSNTYDQGCVRKVAHAHSHECKYLLSMCCTRACTALKLPPIEER